jgi:hypothetical protein
MKRLALASLVLPLCLAVTAGRAEDKVPETPWYPLGKGTTWSYRAGDGKFQMRVAGHEKVGDVLCARVEMSKDGKVSAVEHIGVTADGVYRYQLEATRGDQKLVETPKPPVLLLRLPPKKGDTFTVNSKVDPTGKTYKGTFKIGEEEVKVGDRSYKCVVVRGEDIEADGLKPTITTWYAENVGMVKQVIAVGDQKIEIELEKFEKGPP